jgi:hypothetical protein
MDALSDVEMEKTPSVEGVFFTPAFAKDRPQPGARRWLMPTPLTVTGRAANRADGALSTVLSGEWEPVVPIVLTMKVFAAAETAWSQVAGSGPALSASHF